MQVLASAIQTSRLCLFSVRGNHVSRLMRFTRGRPALSLPVNPIALAVTYVKGMQYPVQSCEQRVYTEFWTEAERGARWSRKAVPSTPAGLWEQLWHEAVGRWRDGSSGRPQTSYGHARRGAPRYGKEVQLLQVTLLFFFKYVTLLGLTDHVDLSAFFTLVINPHLPNGRCGQLWYFAYSLCL